MAPANALSKLARDVSTASSSAGSISVAPVHTSVLRSIDQRAERSRRSRRPITGALVPDSPNRPSASSSGTSRLVTPNSSLAPLSNEAPSLRNQVGMRRLGLVGPEVGSAGPAAGSAASPEVGSSKMESPPSNSTCHRRSDVCASAALAGRSTVATAKATGRTKRLNIPSTLPK